MISLEVGFEKSARSGLVGEGREILVLLLMNCKSAVIVLMLPFNSALVPVSYLMV